MTPRAKAALRLTLGMIVLAGAAAYLWFGDTGVRQARRLREVREHLPAVTRSLEHIPRFKKVRAHVYTGRGGAMMLSGTVATVADYDALQDHVRSLQLPVTVVNRVTLEDGSHPEEFGPDHSP